MCGVVGFYRQTGIREQDHGALDQAMATLRFRGPDSEGTWLSDCVLLGHTRLAIIDPESGQQPWIDPVSEVALSYNGELYNHRNLRSILEGKGHQFRTQCDTEVLVHAYTEWGMACLSKLRGIFAFALVDRRKDRLWLVRDRLGVKPLYYRMGPGTMSFGSSLAAILRMDAAVPPRWCPAAVAHYLMTARPEFGHQTIFASIYKLEPGTSLCLSLETGVMETRRYWSLPTLPADEKVQDSIESATAKVVDLLNESFREQLLSSDVPVGAFLSGGLDSAILCGSLHQEGAALTAYSIGYEREAYHEWAAMERTALRCGLNWKTIRAAEEDFWGDCDRLIRHRGGPLTTPNEMPIYRMAQAFGQDCKVTLTGEGADELFGGYTGPTFSAFDYDRSLGAGGGITKQALLRGYGQDQFNSRCEHFLLANTWLHPADLKRILPGARNSVRAGLDEAEAWYAGQFAAMSELSTFDTYLHLHTKVNLEALLNRLDSSTMRASVEGRVPFTDHRLAEYLFTLPDAYKMQVSPQLARPARRAMNVFELDYAGEIETKRLLRKGYAGLVDPEILRRRKVSFPVPFSELLGGVLKPQLNACLREASHLAGLLADGQDLTVLLDRAGEKAPLLSWLLMNLALTESRWGVTA